MAKGKRWQQRKIGFGLALALLASGSGCGHAQPNRAYATADDAPIVGSWVELGPGGSVIARTVAPGPGCPTLDTNLGPAPMDVRVAANANFPATCEKQLPAGTDRVSLNGRPLPLPARKIHRIVVIGDTGCRIKIQSGQPPQLQNCVRDWPFAKLATTAASFRPDLVIHVGDYHYRESPCPAGDAGCAGSISGDVWASWYQDFFRPANDLLAAAPWVFARGNHETCSRAGAGYFRMLDPRPMPAGACPDQTDPYLVTAGKSVPPLAIFDSASADPTAQLLAPLANLAEPLRKAGGGWLITHRPLWTPVGAGADPNQMSLVAKHRVHPAIVENESDDPDEEKGESSTLANAAPPIGVPDGINLVLTGHRHVFEAMSFVDHRAPLIIGGDSGTALETDIPAGDLTGAAVDTTRLASWTAIPDFGFIELVAEDRLFHGRSWTLIVHDPDGGVLKSCRLLKPRKRGLGMRLEC